MMHVRVSRLKGGQTWYTVIPPNSKPRVFTSKADLFAAFPVVAKAFPKPKAARSRNINRTLTPQDHFRDSASKEVRAARLENLQKAARTLRSRKGSLKGKRIDTKAKDLAKEVFWNIDHPLNARLRERFGHRDDSIGVVHYNPTLAELRRDLGRLQGRPLSRKQRARTFRRRKGSL